MDLTEGSETSAKQSDAGEIPKRKHTRIQLLINVYKLSAKEKIWVVSHARAQYFRFESSSQIREFGLHFFLAQI
jgi:hypothetical protein